MAPFPVCVRAGHAWPACYDRVLRMTALLALLLAAAPAASQPSTPEMRGVWVVRTAMVSPQAVDQAVEEAARAGYNALFVQVRGRGDAFYRSSIVPRSELLRGQPAGFDPLARLLDAARARGLRVHAWMNVLLTAGFDVPLARDHVLARHPEWAMVPRAQAARALTADRGERLALARAGAPPAAEGHYLSPAVPAVGAHLEAVVRELVAGYGLDGLHLDFIRYPSPEYDWSPAALRAFRARAGKGWLLDAPARDPEGWSAFHREALDGLVARLSTAARRARPGIVISAAVVPDAERAGRERHQGWTAWLESGLIDAACPMAYTPDTREFREQITVLRARLGGERLWAGVGAYRLPVQGVVEKIHAAREAGAAGVVVFSHESLRGGDLDRLRTEAFAVPRR